MMARFLGLYIPGHPTMLVQNMPGAEDGSEQLVEQFAKPDGLTFTTPAQRQSISRP